MSTLCLSFSPVHLRMRMCVHVRASAVQNGPISGYDRLYMALEEPCTETETGGQDNTLD